jgi:NAD(P)-dependent dehydrogenase (short-subunit alcohol dehydrogenase family)
MSRKIVITGAGTGLGRALARRFVADGETVALMGRRRAKLDAVAAELGERACVIECDVGQPDSVRAAFAEVRERFDRLDVLINNAAVFKPFLIAEATDAQILGSLATNLAGPILCAREAIPLMRRGAHIINVSSETVAHAYYPFLTLYQCTKAGLEQFSKNLGHELKEQGVRVTTVRAGPMRDDEMGWDDADMAQVARFHQAAKEAGLDFSKSPTSHFRSVTNAFRAVIDLPEDVIAPLVVLGARAP